MPLGITTNPIMVITNSVTERHIIQTSDAHIGKTCALFLSAR